MMATVKILNEDARLLAIRASHWTWGRAENGTLDNESVRAVCLVDIATSLRNIDQALHSLGNDGIHALIRLAKKEHIRRAQVAKAHAKAARKRRAQKKAARHD